MPESRLNLGQLLGRPKDEDATNAEQSGGVAAILAASVERSRTQLSADELAKLPPAEFIAHAYTAFFGQPPDRATFILLRDRLLLGELSRARMLTTFARRGDPDIHLKGLMRLKLREQLHGSAPMELALSTARLARDIGRLPRNLSRPRKAPAKIAAVPPSPATARQPGKPRIAVVAPSSPNGEIGGAERLFTGLCEALEAIGMTAELVAPPIREDSFRNIRQAYRRFYELDLSGFDGVISTKAPSYAVRHPNHVCYLVHTIRAWYDMFEATHPYASARTHLQRRKIQALDTAALMRPSRLFAIGEEVASRLRSFNGLDAQVLYFPATLPGLRTGAYNYLLLPGRLHPWKRVDLAIKAMRFVRAPVPLIIAGTGQEEASLRAMAKGDTRISFTGRVTDERLAALYAQSLGVLFVPRHEDYGLITLEAFTCEKPVICCSDSGEPARMVQNDQSGFVIPPDPRQIGDSIGWLMRNPTRASAMGKAGAASIAGISWDHVARSLCAALGFQPA
jgi:glycosyltransferase involved in cell wall biosynthesis